MVGRPVKWQCERREAIPADEHARDNVTEAELALDADGQFLALRVKTLANVGAYVSSDRNLLATFSNIATLVASTRSRPRTCRSTPSSPTRTRRPRTAAPGVPNQPMLIERLIDDTAQELALDRLAAAAQEPHPESAMRSRPRSAHYDCGQFEKNMDARAEGG